ncbi:hypothetical protein [Elioraea rosea]|uniref:hypothetical protein n=1 Tax=Elioraea rosea TaxID=2492390 RepID=UPI001186A6D4|nr:hypothetical protein [Elioraea rosea]
MTARPALDRRTLAELSARIATARPEAIRAVVALIDRLPNRGDADALIAPMRPRLTMMRDLVRRPASLGRVLGHPVEDLLVSPDLWRRGSLSVPRSIMPIAISLAAEALPIATRRELHDRISGATMDDAACVGAVGAVLWPAASARFAELASGPLPAGLALPMREADLRGLLGALGETLRLAPDLAALLAANPRGSTAAWEHVEHGLRDAMSRAAALSPDCFARVGLILMRRFMATGPVVALLRDVAVQSTSGGAERRLAAALDSFLAELPEQLPDAAALALLPHQVQQHVIADAVATVDRATAEIGTWQAERRDNLREVQAHVTGVIRRRVPQCLASELLAPVARIQAEGLDRNGGPAGLEGLEAAARAVSAMAGSARRLAPSEELAIEIRRAVDTLAALAVSAPQGAPADRLGRTDLARLVEILAGPDQAERVLGTAA